MLIAGALSCKRAKKKRTIFRNNAFFDGIFFFFGFPLVLLPTFSLPPFIALRDVWPSAPLIVCNRLSTLRRKVIPPKNHHKPLLTFQMFSSTLLPALKQNLIATGCSFISIHGEIMTAIALILPSKLLLNQS